MEFADVWSRLAPATRTWLVDHNGEPLPEDVVDEIDAAAEGRRNPRWWSGKSDDGETQLTDEAVDWIDETANSEE